MRYFEDMVVGEIRRFGNYHVTREEVLDFASRYDPQPFHLSDEAAARTHFGRLAASGWHTCAMTMSMMVADFEDDKQAGLGSPGVDELRFLKPVFPGDTLRCESELLNKQLSRSRPNRGSLWTQIRTFNQNDEMVLCFIGISMIQARGG